jgi:peroxiredoxin Q/BCP
MSSHSLAVGKAAPEFDLPASDGERYRLSQFRGRAVVICWFPKAHTWG